MIMVSFSILMSPKYSCHVNEQLHFFLVSSEITGVFFSITLSSVIELNRKSNCIQTCAVWVVTLGHWPQNSWLSVQSIKLLNNWPVTQSLFTAMCALFQSQCHSLFSSGHSSRGFQRIWSILKAPAFLFYYLYVMINKLEITVKVFLLLDLISYH